MITDDEIERVITYLRDNAVKAAKCKAERLYLEDYCRVLKSNIMREHLSDSVAAQERDAYADVRYSDHLLALRAAIEEDEKMTYLRKVAEAKIEAWRTMCSNNRVSGKV